MVEYIVDLAIVAVIIIGTTATNGIISNAIGLKLFGGKTKNEIVDQSVSMQTGWKNVGGNKK
ncbi:hypothetical protein [Bacillus sp. B15-48]|uniref:hypothetical protein n=1 Tax=Bacillus sp. B15-48 TaxID=1548601 RepID=UPI00193F4BB0|nr:hypothetical protein [Bacillus sp. B15-48]MBM4764247.1 hypothetical protein [Bacillus sp. B15-48]